MRKRNWIKRVCEEKSIRACFWVLGIMVLLAVLVPAMSPYPYDAQDINLQNQGIFTRSCYGLRVSLLVGFGSTTICVIIAIFVGTIAGSSRGLIDDVILEIMNVISAIPSMIYVILMLLVLEASVKSVIIGICISGWIDLAKMIRTETRRLRQMDYCIAAEMMEISRLRIVRKYILPNELKLLVGQMILMIPKAMFTEAFLSFLGIGISAPRASLGMLIRDAKIMILQYPTQILFPIMMLVVLVTCLQSLGYLIEKKI